MTKKELIEKLSNDHGVTKVTASDILDNIFETIGNTVKKTGRFSVVGFGTFSLQKRKARKGRNPQTGEVIKIKASKSMGFKPSPKLKASL